MLRAGIQLSVTPRQRFVKNISNSVSFLFSCICTAFVGLPAEQDPVCPIEGDKQLPKSTLGLAAP